MRARLVALSLACPGLLTGALVSAPAPVSAQDSTQEVARLNDQLAQDQGKLDSLNGRAPFGC